MNEHPLDRLLDETDWMRALARHLVRDPDASQDLLQETWVNLLRRPPSDRRAVRPWIYTVMLNLVRNRHRGRTRRLRRELEWTHTRDTEWADPDQPVRSEILEQLRRSLMGLSEAQQELLGLRYASNLTPKQIAEHLDVPAPTVRTRLKRALDGLRDDMDARHDGERSAWSGLLLTWAGWQRAPDSGGAGAELASLGKKLSSVVTGQLVGVSILAVLIVGATAWTVTAGRGRSQPATKPVVAAAPSAPSVTVLPPPTSASVEPLQPEAPVPTIERPSVESASAPPPPPTDLIVLDVVDKITGELLGDVEVRLADFNLHRPHNQLLMDRHESLPSRSAARFSARWKDIAELRAPDRDDVGLFVRAPGHGWKLVDVSEGSIGTQTVGLPRCVPLDVELALSPSAGDLMVGWQRAEMKHRQFTRLSQRGHRDGAQWRDTWNELIPGDYLVEVLCQHEPPRVLVSQAVTLRAGQPQSVSLAVPTEPRQGRPVELSGVLTVPAEAGQLPAWVRLIPVDEKTQHANSIRLISIEAAREIGPGPVLRPWSTGMIPPGKYALLILPFRLGGRTIHLQDDMPYTVDCELPALATIHITTVVGETGEPIGLQRVMWGLRGENKEDFLFLAHDEDQPGHLTIHCAPGDIDIKVQSLREYQSPMWSGTHSLRAEEGVTEITIPAQRNPSLIVRLMDGDRQIPLSKAKGHAFHYGRVDGGSYRPHGLMDTQGFFQTDTPGLYWFNIQAGPEYHHVPIAEIELLGGEPVEHVIHLHRR